MRGDRDLAFEAMTKVCSMDYDYEQGRDNLSVHERGKVNDALKKIRDLGPSEDDLPAMIEARARAFHSCYPEIPTTPQALLNHWSSIEEKARKLSSRVVNARRSSDCPTCGGDRWVPAGVDDRGYDLSAPCPECNSDRKPDQPGVDPPVPRGRAVARPAPAAPLTVTCSLCGEEIYEAERRTMYAQEVTWQPAVVHRKGGGIHDRGKGWKRTGALAHERCVNGLVRGTLNQQDLFSEQLKLS